MNTTSNKNYKSKSDARRESLITATLNVIAREGVAAATVRTISREAEVTQGLIRYYFQSKDDLIAAAYEAHMDGMMDVAEESMRHGSSAISRFIRYIEASLVRPVASQEQVSVWAGFFQILLHDEKMIESHKHSYNRLRLRTKSLLADVYQEAGIPKSDAELRRLSISACALLDGLWIEGGAIGDTFHPGELNRIGLESFGALLGIDLKAHKDSIAACDTHTPSK